MSKCKIKDSEALFNEFMELQKIVPMALHYKMRNLATMVQNNVEIPVEDLAQWMEEAEDVKRKLEYLHRVQMENYAALVHKVVEYAYSVD
jgi:hypothetical protein